MRFETLDHRLQLALTTAMVSDSMDRAGLRGQVMARGIEPLVAGSRAVGRARTLQFEASEADSDEPYAAAMEFIDSLSPGSVPVIGTGGDDRTGYWGELFSAAATGRGAVATVCDGPVRDVAKIKTLGYPVFAYGSRPIDFRARMQVCAVGGTIRCAGVSVTSGDLVFADDDGVAVLPASHEDVVLELAVARATAENDVLTELLAGASLREVWQRWRVL